jgi:hypothetical protein
MRVFALILSGLAANAAAGLTPTQSATPSPTPTIPQCELAPVPAAAPAGTYVELSGTCGRILHHRLVSIYFDRTLVVQFDGPGPQYSTGFVVPRRAEPGRHTLTMESGPIPFGEVTAPFEVTGERLPCSGDCNRDERVLVDELVTGVGITLGTQASESCPAFDIDTDEVVAVNELVLGVDAAMRGCDPEPGCHNHHECENGARCLAPGEFRGCGICQPFEDECERDGDCGGELICAAAQDEDCPCNPVMICQPGCGGGSTCGTGERCADGHCVPQRCGPELCPRHFRCQPVEGFGDGCVRQPCLTEDTCDGGFCVNGACYPTLGTCALPVP